MLLVPRDITANDKIKIATIGSSNLIKYSHCKCEVVNEVLLEKNLIIFVRSGRKKIRTWNHSTEVGAGQGVMVRQGAYIMTETVCSEEEFCSVMIMLDNEFIIDFLARYKISAPKNKELQPPPPFLPFTINHQINAALDSITPYWNIPGSIPKPLFDLKLHEMLICLTTSIGDSTFHRWISEVGSDSTRLLKVFMERNIDKDWSIDRFAKEYGLSLSAFKREFFQVYGTSPRAWINARRLNMALAMLRATERSITEIGLSVGYTDVAHFSASFKKHFGCSPRQVRKDPHLADNMAADSQEEALLRTNYC